MLARLNSVRAAAAALATLLALQAPAWAQEEDIEEEGGEGVEERFDPDQPSVYSGGRYTIVNFPVSELDRTLLLVDGVLELRADLDIEMSKGATFDVWTINLEGRYGLGDTMELEAGASFQAVVPDGADRAISAFAAVEGSIMYDLLDWRVGLGIPIEPDVAFDIFFGLPLKYRILKDRLAILAFEKILTIHTDEDAAGDLRKPDLTISVGGLVQVLKQLAVIVRAEVTIVGFEGDPVVPLSIDGQYTINSQMDVGVTLRLRNLTAKQAQTVENPDPKRIPVDNRSVAVFFRFRI